MNKRVKLESLSVVMSIGLLGFVAGCPTIPMLPENGGSGGDGGDSGNGGDGGTATPPQAFLDASAARGGVLYDKFWTVAGLDEPTSDHPLWASRPDTESNARTGADTWRCKECHGWDYKGVDGAYASGSHRTGIAGLFGTARSAQEVFDIIETDHAYGDAGLSADDVWDLAKFVLEGQIDTDDIIGGDGVFIGDVTNGQTLFETGIGGNLACMVCHGADGLTINFAEPPEQEFVGTVASDNPWEFQHKVRFGQPGTLMPAAVDVNATNDDVADVGAYAQTLSESQ